MSSGGSFMSPRPHPAAQSVKVKALIALIDKWNARAHAVGRHDPDDPRVLPYRVAARELIAEIEAARRDYADMLKKIEAERERDLRRERDAVLCMAQYARKHRRNADRHRKSARDFRADGRFLAARESFVAADNAARAAERAARAVEVLCDYADLDPEEYLKD